VQVSHNYLAVLPSVLKHVVDCSSADIILTVILRFQSFLMIDC